MDVELHPNQLKVYEDQHRFQVVAAGRRFGKSFLAAVKLFVEAAQTTKVRSDGVEVDLSLEKVYYVAPTFTQGKEIIWPLLKELGHDLIEQSYENEASLRLVNGRTIHIKGADRPDSLRGTGLSYVVLDEYAFMKESVWEKIILPQMARSEGRALFIGTPDGKNHFYHTWLKGQDPDSKDWKSWVFHTTDNPHLPSTEVDMLTENMSSEQYRQEIEASFETGGGVVLTADMFPIRQIAGPGNVYIACDLAGFEKVDAGRKIQRLDESAIAVVKSHAHGWHILNIIHGRWDVRETALRIVKAYRDYRPMKLGIEKGMSKNAVLPYLEDEQLRLNTFFEVEDLSHGNQRKTDRIAWALQGRAEKGRITLEPGEWNRPFLEQAVDFPSTLTHDDLIDAVAYIDQIAEPWFDGPIEIDDWEPLDDIAGY